MGHHRRLTEAGQMSRVMDRSVGENAMNVCTFTELREHLRERLDQVHQTRTPLLVTRQNAAAAVVIDKEEYDGIMETLHLLRSPVNAARLIASITAAEAGRSVSRDLIEP